MIRDVEEQSNVQHEDVSKYDFLYIISSHIRIYTDIMHGVYLIYSHIRIYTDIMHGVYVIYSHMNLQHEASRTV